MKNLPKLLVLLFLLPVLFNIDQNASGKGLADNNCSWIQSLLNTQDTSTNCNNCIFYCTGHNGMIWSLITLDSSEIHIFNGTTRRHIEKPDNNPFNSSKLIENNINTITWAFDSLECYSKLLTPLKNGTYNPVYSELSIIKDGNTVFSYKNSEYYCDPNNKNFNCKLEQILFLMYWLAAPSSRPYLRTPSDTFHIPNVNHSTAMP